MKRNILLYLFLFSFVSVFSQQTVYKFRISFKDKNNSLYSISNPSAFLTQKAINRRINQGIAINTLDIPVNHWYIDSIANLGINIINQSRWFNSIIVSMTDTNSLDIIRLMPFVKNVESVIAANNIKKKKNSKNINEINSIYFKPQQLNNNFTQNENDLIENADFSSVKSMDYGQSFLQINMLQGVSLHNQGFMGQGMTIAILDAGFWQVDVINVFDSLWLNGQILGTRDFVSPGNNVFNESTHGMMVLSTMGANLQGQMVGTAPKANYWLLRTEDAGSENIIEEDNWASGAEFADSIGADIINSSLGYTTFDDPAMNHSYMDMDGKTTIATRAAVIAARKGILVVNSAGNSGGGWWKYIGAPADADSIITVGAVNSSGNYASFSSIGPTYDNRVKPTVMALGEGSAIATSGGISNGNGTSFAAPILCGMTACLWQAFPQRNNQEIIQAIKMSASQYYTPDSAMGYGIPNFPVAAILLSGNNIHNFDNENSFNVFPNPFVETLYIAYNSVDTQRVSIELYDLNGKNLFTVSDLPRYQGYNSITINNLFLLKSGLYIIRMTSGNKTSTQKVMKN